MRLEGFRSAATAPRLISVCPRVFRQVCRSGTAAKCTVNLSLRHALLALAPSSPNFTPIANPGSGLVRVECQRSNNSQRPSESWSRLTLGNHAVPRASSTKPPTRRAAVITVSPPRLARQVGNRPVLFDSKPMYPVWICAHRMANGREPTMAWRIARSQQHCLECLVAVSRSH